MATNNFLVSIDQLAMTWTFRINCDGKIKAIGNIFSPLQCIHEFN